MELDTVNAYSTVRMEQGLSGDPWDCLFGSDSISDAFQGSPEMFHMDIRRCDNTGRIGFHGPNLGFDFYDVLTETEQDLIDFNDRSSSNSNMDEINPGSDIGLALTLDPNLILPRNMSMPIRGSASNSEATMLETASVEENVAENEGEETENESEAERTENDEENESEEEEEIENEENEHNETEYETEEEETEEEEEEEEEETEEDDEQDTAVRRPLTPSSMEAPTSISSSSAGVGARTLTASSSPTIQLTRVQMQHPKISTVSGTIKVQDIKMLAANPTGQTSHHIRKQIYNNNVHDVGPGATTTVMIQAAKREKDLMVGHRDNTYPKPAYSYSCLIAMALKNSEAGSLPVSEIYNFMCQHFPYFKTAPTGWKNSVRHNLSLNKCFEKIEKPPGNGSQRKGCLWAIHPSKIAKMDEEVRKWSRKDPTAIKRAMVHPEHLELLERGEMKYEGDRHEEIYEDAESYADSETGGSAVDETINDDENVTYDETKNIDIVDDELVDDDIVVEQLYDELNLVEAELLDTRLNDFSRQEQSFVYELVPCTKRQKTISGSPIQSDYVYQQVDVASRKKAHLVALRPGTAPGSGSLLEAD